MSGKHPSGAQILHGLRSAKEQEQLQHQLVTAAQARLQAQAEAYAQDDKGTLCGMAATIKGHSGCSAVDAAKVAFDLFEAVEDEWARRGQLMREKMAAAEKQTDATTK